MTILDAIRTITPEPVKKIFRPIIYPRRTKYEAALVYWKKRFVIENGQFDNSNYKRMMLAMAQETTDDFLKGKIVADFGCGPRGSLIWAGSAQLRIGIDVLANQYADEFTDNITSHGMIYVTSTEKVIPLSSGFVDIMFTLNAIDHVFNFPIMCSEILRVLKPGGEFIGSFNLEEPVTTTEPQVLNEEIIKDNLLSKMEVQSYRITEKGPREHPYTPFFSGKKLVYRQGQEGFLWVRAKKMVKSESFNVLQRM